MKTAKPSLLVNAVALVLLLAYPVYTLATCTYTRTTSPGQNTTIQTCNTTTETGPTLSTDGQPVGRTGVVSVFAKGSAAMTAGGKLEAYVYNADAAQWFRYPAADLTAVASTNQTWAPVDVSVPNGRVDFKPAGIGAITTTVYVVGQTQ